MITYEYKCKENGHLYSEMRSINEDQKNTECPECGSTLLRIYSVPPIMFKGEGFANPFI